LNTFAIVLHFSLFGGLISDTASMKKYSIVRGVGKMLTPDHEGNIHAALGISLLIWSVIWPHAKLVLLHYTWCKNMTEGRRWRWLSVLGTVGKFSLLDVFMVVLIVSSIQFTDLAGKDNWAVATAQEGIYIFLFAAFASQVLSAVMAEMHRSVAEKKDKDREDSEKISLVSTSKSSIAIFVGALLAIAGFVPGMFMPIYTLKRFVHAAPIVNYNDDLKHSMASGIALCFDTKTSSAGHSTLAVLALIIGVGLPFAHMLLCALFVWVPMTRRTTQKVIATMEILAEWAALDVYFICLAPISAELGSLTKGLADGHVEVSFEPIVTPMVIGIMAVIIQWIVHYSFVSVARLRVAGDQPQGERTPLMGTETKD